MEKNILQDYTNAKARVKYLHKAAEKLEKKIERLEYTGYGIVGDTVSRGKRGKKPLGTVKISGFPVPEYQETVCQLKLRKKKLKAEEIKLGRLVNEAEGFIASVSNIEMRNILSFHYIEGMTWAQVAYSMNVLYNNKIYTSDSCRVKHERFLKKI